MTIMPGMTTDNNRTIMKKPNRIVLIGFKSCGKTTVGRMVAKQAGMVFIDLDDEVEKTYAKEKYRNRVRCREIYKKEGERYFRTLEQRVLRGLKTKKSYVLSVGGGVPSRGENQALLRRLGTVVYLEDEENEVYARIIRNGVPAFFSNTHESWKSFLRLWRERVPMYKRVAHVTLDKRGRSIDWAVDEVLALMGKLPKRILLIHGPNLNLLGKRAKKHYGAKTLADIEHVVRREVAKKKVDVLAYQSNHEGDIIDFLQHEAPYASAILINPGAYTHYSVAILDALVDTHLPYVEVHLSDIGSREVFRRESITGKKAMKIIFGKKERGYVEGVRVLVGLLSSRTQ